MAFLGDFGKFFGLGSSEEVLGDVGEFVAGKPGRFVGEAAARATDNLAGDGGISPASTADQALEQSAVSVSKRGDVPQELSTMTGTRGMTTQAGFGALAPLFGTASRFLGSKSGQIVTGVGTAVGLGGASFMGSDSRMKPVLTQSRRNKAKVRQLVNFMGIEGTANFLSQSMNTNVSPNDVVALLLRTFRNDGAYITKAQVRNLRRTTNRFKSLEKQVKEATSMSRTTRRAPVRRASSTTLIKN
tara:strand:- start:392 stop:1123 length:732 start_codon:yes stop_codon:yes gene_type:complete